MDFEETLNKLVEKIDDEEALNLLQELVTVKTNMSVQINDLQTKYNNLKGEFVKLQPRTDKLDMGSAKPFKSLEEIIRERY